MSEYWAAPQQRELVRPYYFQENERLPQYETEAVLRRKLASLANVECLFGWSAETIVQTDDAVHVSIAEQGGSGRCILTADYAVGCDGGRSIVREQAGIERGGADYDQTMVLAVFRSRELHEGLKRFPGRSTYNVLHPDKPARTSSPVASSRTASFSRALQPGARPRRIRARMERAGGRCEHARADL